MACCCSQVIGVAAIVGFLVIILAPSDFVCDSVFILYEICGRNMSLDVGPMTELVQHGSPTAQVLSSSPKAGYSPISGNSPRGGLRSPRNKKNFQREMLEESSNVTKVDARRYSDYTVYESTQMEVTFNSNLLEVDRGLALESESRGAPVGSSDTLSAVGGRPDSMRPLGAEVLAESADELADGQTASIMTGDVEQTDMEMSLKSVDFSDVDKRDEELFAHDKECEVSASGEYGLMNEECLYNEIGHESVAEMDESAEITSERCAVGFNHNLLIGAFWQR